jgi:hypothetical protein
MAIAENDPHCIGANGLKPGYGDIALAEYELFLSGAMAFHFGTGTFDAEIFSLEIKRFACVKANVENPALLF